VLAPVEGRISTDLTSVLPRGRERYLSEVAVAVRGYHTATAAHVEVARRRQQLSATRDLLEEEGAAAEAVEALLERSERQLPGDVRDLLDQWPAVRDAYAGDEYVYQVRGADVRTPLTRETLSGTRMPR
jgi:methylmalonyl-CoA mutase